MNDHSQVFLDDYGPTDFCSLVKLNYLLEKIYGFCISKPPAADPHMEVLNSEMSVQIFQNELHEWSLSVPLEVRTLCLSTLP